MKNKLQILIAVLSALVGWNNTANSQSPNWLWAVGTGGTGDDYGYSIATDASGNIFVSGIFRSPSIIFGSTTLNNAGNADVFIAKYDNSGNVMWARGAGGASIDYCHSSCTDASGNVYITGTFYGASITFDTITLYQTGFADLFIVKFDSNGNVVWAKSAYGTDSDVGYGITTDVNGNVFVSGAFASPSLTFGATTLNNAGTGGSLDIFIVKYSAGGNLLWAKKEGGTGSDNGGSSITTDASGNVIVTGEFGSASMTIGTTTLTNAGGLDIFIVKYDAGGNVLWANGVGGASSEGGGRITTDAGNNIFVTGNFNSLTLTFGSTTLNKSFTSNYDIYIAKFDGSGNALWAKSASGISYRTGSFVSTDAGGGVLLSGSFDSPSITFNTTTLTNAGSGNLLWAIKAGGAGGDFGYSIFNNENGNAFLTGAFGNPSIVFGSTTLTNAGLGDIFVAKLGGTTGVEENSVNGEQINISPNPFTDELIVSGSELGEIKIYDIYGRLVYAQKLQTANYKLQTANYKLQTANWASGIYFVGVITDERKEVKKIVKQ